eukprot:CAMPEP_0175141300 /NCGR_PEP_ID=MMETSP0087-20121206/12031_1 /TAXON_ID=136419 /ORGANISM="Unknown Unknown, Strain D1" /LENGTH=333 /DNA_ID=CAMNT_0016424705 /DNA_START=71 /DNA_END=1072 /DNA_ORIENTATION=+
MSQGDLSNEEQMYKETEKHYKFFYQTFMAEFRADAGNNQNPSRGDRGDGRDMCQDFLHGRCNWGSRCNYSHDIGGRRERSMSPGRGRGGGGYDNYDRYGGRGRSRSPPQNKRNSKCRDFQHGKCTRGSQCRYEHIKEKCSDYIKGVCSRGSDCRYSHDLSSGWIPEECADFKKGVCTFGDQCRYSHSIGNMRKGVCKDFQNGNCNRTNCRFSHVSEQSMRGHSYNDSQGGYGNQRGGGGQGQGNDHRKLRPGDWLCSDESCKGHNFAKRTECYRCGAPRDGDGDGDNWDARGNDRRRDGGNGGDWGDDNDQNSSSSSQQPAQAAEEDPWGAIY